MSTWSSRRWSIRAGALVALVALGGSPGRSSAEIDPKLRLELVKGMRAYLEPEADPFNGRESVRIALGKIEAAGGGNLLAQMPVLRDVTYQGRGFLADYRDRKWQKLEANTEVNEGKFAVSVSRGDKLRLAFSAPKKTHTADALAKLPRPEPFPTLVTLIEERDYTGKKFPGEETIARRYSTQKELFEKWLILAPVAVRGNYVEDGNVRQLFFTAQLKDFYQRCHVDFERMVLDGDTSTVTTIAAAQPFMYAGLVLRRPLSGEPVIDPDTVANYAQVPVYVVGCPLTEKALKEAGHGEVTLGDEAGLMGWMSARRRVIPTTFSWRIKGAQQVFAHWLVVEPDWNVERRTLDVAVLDTPEDPNTIRIDARGVLDLTAFLNDEIVRLDKDVRIVLNGKEVFKGRLERTLERMFDREPISPRASMWFGMLFPAMTTRLFAPPPPPEAAPGGAAPGGGTTAPAGAPADPEKEAKAQGWFDKAQQFAADGNTDKAIQIFEKIINELGETSVATKAKEQVASLKAGK